jgi:hypothetical protein
MSHEIHSYASALLSLALSFTPSAAAQNGEPGTGYLVAKVDPGTAGIFVDGKYVGTASNFRRARKYTLIAGEHEITFSDPRYEELKTKITIHAGGTVTLSEHLRELPKPAPPFGRMRIMGFDKYAAVFLNGKFYGHADELSNFVQGLLIRPGEYALRVEPMNGGPVHEQTVKIELDKTTVVRAR